MQLVTPQASAPTWFFWHFLVIAAVVIAAVAAVWPPPAWSALAPAQPMPDPPGQRSMLAVLTRQTLAMLVLAALLAGLMTGLREAAILVAGLLVAGPVLTLILPYVPAPAVVARAPFAVRWVAAMTIALIVSVLIESLAGDALGDTYLVIVVTLAVVAPLFRVILEAGSTPRAADAHPTRHAPPPAVVNSALLVLALTLWLALPAAALAHNCPSRAAGEDKVCVKYNFDAVPALIGGALAAAGGAMWSGLRRLEQEDRDRAKTFWNMFFWWGPDWSKVNRKTEKDLPPWTPDSRRDYDPDDPLPR
jgi:hypothetical protein